MSRVTISIKNQPAGGQGGVDASRWAVAGLSDRGPVDQAVTIRSLSQFVDEFGDRVTYGLLYDAADAFFHEAGTGGVMSVARVVGPSAVAATHTFDDNAANDALTVTAKSPGAWGNNLTVQITAGTAGGTFVLKIYESGTLVETSPDLANASDAIAWAADKSDYVVVTDPGAVGDPAVIAATALTTGDDDRDNIVTGSWETPLTLAAGLGGCQLSAPGNSASGVQNLVCDIAAATRCTALLDSTPGADATTIAAQFTAITSDGARWAAILAPWATVPGLTANTTRDVPYSAIQAGMTSRSDRVGGPVPLVNRAVAGDNGVSTYAIGLETTFTAAELTTLDDAQIIAARIDEQGRVQTYGDRTLADEDTDPQWYQLGAVRTIMYVASEFEKVGRRFVFATLDPRLVTVGKLKGALAAVLQSLSPDQIANDPATAVTASQNTTTRTLSGAGAVQPNQAAEAVAIDVLVEVS